MGVLEGVFNLTFLPAQVFPHPTWHCIKIWDAGGWDPTERSSRSNLVDFQVESDTLHYVHRVHYRHSSSSGHTQSIQGQSAWKYLRIAKGQHKWLVASKQRVLNSFLGHPHHLFFIYSKPEVMQMHTQLSSRGREDQGRKTALILTSFPCTSTHPNAPFP